VIARPSKELKQNARDLVARTWASEAVLTLFLGLLILTLFVFPTLGVGADNERRYGNLVFVVIMTSGVAIAWGQRIFPIVSGIGCAVVVLKVIGIAEGLGSWVVWNEVLSLVGYATLSWILFQQIFRPGPITGRRVQAAIAIYLLIGLLWASAYRLTSKENPKAFGGSAEISTGSSSIDWYYFSFVTLTTVGYGDLVPVSRVARSLATGEALTGQLYLAVLIARLVAAEVVAFTRKRMGPDES
jgi:voltage-gated potassium channel Kch